jgi:hypothetical protein
MLVPVNMRTKIKKEATCMVQDEPHIALLQLWEYSRDLISLKIPLADRNHLRNCQDCVAVVWLCRGLPSIEAVEARLQEGIIGRARERHGSY